MLRLFLWSGGDESVDGNASTFVQERHYKNEKEPSCENAHPTEDPKKAAVTVTTCPCLVLVATAAAITTAAAAAIATAITIGIVVSVSVSHAEEIWLTQQLSCTVLYCTVPTIGCWHSTLFGLLLILRLPRFFSFFDNRSCRIKQNHDQKQIPQFNIFLFNVTHRKFLREQTMNYVHGIELFIHSCFLQSSVLLGYKYKTSVLLPIISIDG